MKMKSARILRIAILYPVGAISPLLQAGDLSTYRGLELGSDLKMAAEQAGVKSTEVKVVHSRPAIIQELIWWPRRSGSAEVGKSDPVQEAVLCFYNGQLFRIVVIYDRYKVAGMTAEDLIEGISAAYGPSTRPTEEIAYHSIYGETVPVIARWEDPQYAFNLVRSGDQTSFGLILYSKRLDVLAQAAIKEASRLDVLEAPQRELEGRRKRDNEQRLSLEQTRSTNKANFRP